MMIHRRHSFIGASLLALSATVGCYNGVNAFDPGLDPSGSGGEPGAAEEDADPQDEPGEDEDELGPRNELPAPTTRFFRLTHQQWENTVQDLFALAEPTGLSSEFRADPFVGGFTFDNNALSLEVDQALWAGYQRAAVDLAEQVAADPSIVDAIAPGDPNDPAARARDFVRSFGQRAFRRPLTETEMDAYVALFDRGDPLFEDTAGFAAGVRLVLEGMLQSPNFLYRVERSDQVVDEVIPLTSWEVASRLSYFLWNTMPDDALLAAAAGDNLTNVEQVRAQAQRMLDDPRAAAVVEHFHHQLLHVEKFTSADPSPAFYPDAPPNLGLLAQQEHDLFLEHVVFTRDGSWRDLLTSTETFVNDDLAGIYGLDGSFGPDFQRVDLDPAERGGLFTQVGFLAANATSANSDPIHRGVFLAKDIACHIIAAPPDDVPTPPLPEPNETSREAVEKLTEVPGSSCASCHTYFINPFGFALENYDATGAFRTTDNGKSVDATATVLFDDDSTAVDGGVELAQALAEEVSVHRCYTEHWMEFAMGRPSHELDEPLLDRLADSSLDDLSVKDVLVEMTTSRPFLTRSTQETAQ